MTHPHGQRRPIAEDPRLYGEWAALDLGSNNFEMLVAAWDGAELRVLERRKEKVQLLRGFRDGRLDDAVVERGLAALSRFAQRLRGVPPERMLARGTHALRVAENRQWFLAPAGDILGVPVTVLSGDEEARLIELAVAWYRGGRMAADGGRQLVVDIGGGSTELVWSDAVTGNRETRRATSLAIGCVSLTDEFFAQPELVAATYPLARARVEAALAGLAAVHQACSVVGTSGSVESLLRVTEANGFGRGSISLAAIAEVETAFAEGHWLADLGLPGLAPERVDIFPAGVAILSALMRALRIDNVEFCEATLPHGIILDALQCGARLDADDAAVTALAARFGVDREQSSRVARTADALVASLPSEHGVDSGTRRLLQHAAALHEIGLAVSASGHQRHGAYIVQNARPGGFSELALQQLIVLVRGHRRGLPLQVTGKLASPALRAAVLALRLAVILERTRLDTHSPAQPSLRMASGQFTLVLPPGWLAAHPLSASELAVECAQWRTAGWPLTVL
ncbi:MAG: Ppx/GppA family phosphatase [Pseudomonadales bacterium]|nr:Ppx/GppA family phosphatase [Pseudomonadales bacterium]MCP5184120.1 Ppx/GppA family phosphatase [Pseudomonadales bacterium]